MNLVQVWIRGIHNPARAFEALRDKPAPQWGLWAVLVRFVPTSLTTTLALHLLGRQPFEPSRLTFLATESYFGAQVFFLPVFGLALWLLGSAAVHVVLRLSGRPGDFDRTLNVVGVAQLIPMPAIWLWDWSMIALDAYRIEVMSVSHAIFALWGVALYAVGFRKALNLPGWLAIVLSVTITAVYIALASIFVR